MKKVEYYGQEIEIPDDHYFVATDDDGQVFSYPKRPRLESKVFGEFWFSDSYYNVLMFRDDLSSMFEDTLVEYPKEGQRKC